MYQPNEAPSPLVSEQNNTHDLPPQPPKRTWVSLSISLSALALIGFSVYFTLTNRQAILDWYALTQYEAPQDIAQLATHTTMVGRGRDMFYVSKPEINDATRFNQNCTDTGEESLVLGCYFAQRIYLYNVTDPRLSGAKEVTAAHEMLHAAYERLQPQERGRINSLLQTQFDTLNDQRLKDLIDLYRQHEPTELLNEMHSILGTEYRGLSPELEAYYKQYFADRGVVVGFAEKYEAVFTESKVRIADYDEQLGSIKAIIDANYRVLETKRTELHNEAARLDSLRQSDPAAYNSAVPGYNVQVSEFNSLVAQTQELVAHYNAIVEKRNAEATAQSDLYNNLDSRYEKIQ